MMKSLFYVLFAAVYNIAVKLRRQNGRAVTLISPHNAFFNDNLGEIENELRKRGGYRIIRLSRDDYSSPLKALSFFTLKAVGLAGAKTMFLNDNFSPMAYMNIPEDCRVVQLWHAMGAFKRFGLDAPQPREIREKEKKMYSKYTNVICSSPGIVDIYAGAFGVSAEKVLPLGLPQAAALLEREKTASTMRSFFEGAFPECAGKKLVLYAPTFRDDPARDAAFLESFDFERFGRELGDTHALLLRLHPQLHSAKKPDGVIDVTSFEDVGALCLLADSLITDYSSICMDFVLLGKPCRFFAPDLGFYENSRSFYFDYRTGVPGPVCETMEQLIASFRSPPDVFKAESFYEKHLSAPHETALDELLKMADEEKKAES